MVNYQSNDIPREVPKEIAINIYRIAQEALRNISKHARATTADIALLGRDDTLHLTIRDDGRGIDPREKKINGLGLASMKERASLISGDFSIQSWSGHGTVIEVTAPLWRSA
jgi:signal transduction histidine kinase